MAFNQIHSYGKNPRNPSQSHTLHSNLLIKFKDEKHGNEATYDNFLKRIMAPLFIWIYNWLLRRSMPKVWGKQSLFHATTDPIG
jgi:hypothetical protein